jgi:hypothetical protein
MENRIKLSGSYNIKVLENKKIVNEINQKNVIIRIPFNQLMSAFAGYQYDFNLAHCAVGDGSGTATEDDTALVAEKARVARSDLIIDDNRVVAQFDFLKDEANYALKEVGIFIRNDILWSRTQIVPTFTKTNLQELIVSYTITWERS